MAKAPRLTADDRKKAQHEKMQRQLAGDASPAGPVADLVLPVSVGKYDLEPLAATIGKLVSHPKLGNEPMVFLGFIGQPHQNPDRSLDGMVYDGQHRFRAATQGELEKGQVLTTLAGLDARQELKHKSEALTAAARKGAGSPAAVVKEEPKKS